MTAVAITFLVLSMVLLWGGLAASIVYLARRPEVTAYPPGDPDDPRAASAPPLRDT